MSNLLKLTDQKKTATPKMRESDRKDNMQLFILTLPVLLKVFIFSYLPIVGIILAFKDYDFSLGIFKSPWIGFKNFEFFFRSNDARRILSNTIGMNFVFIATGTVFSVLTALLMYQIIKHKLFVRTYQTTMLFPVFISAIVAGILLDNIIGSNGLLTSILERLGISISFYSIPAAWRFILPIVNVWKTVGYSSIIYFGILMGTDTSLYEAAKIDGANNFQLMLKLQVPFLIPMIVLQTLVSIGNILRADFGMFYFLPGAKNTLVLEATDVIDTYIFRAITNNGSLAMGAAVGLFQSFVGFLLITVSNTISRRCNDTYGLY